MKKRILSCVLAVLLMLGALPSAGADAKSFWPKEVKDRYDYIELPRTWGNDLGDPDRLYSVRKDGKYGFINLQGEELVPPIYDGTEYLQDGMGSVRKDNGVGFVDKTGKLIVPIVYDRMYPGWYSEGVFIVEKAGKSGFVDTTGKELSDFVYDAAGSFVEGLCPVFRDGKMGFVNTKGQLQIPLIYDEPYTEWGALRFSYFGDGLAPVSKGGLMGYIDRNGNVRIPFQYDQAYEFFGGLAAVCQDYRWGYIDTSGAVRIPFQYQEAESFWSDTAIVRDSRGRVGTIDRNGQPVSGFKYEIQEREYVGDDLDGVTDPVWIVQKDWKYGVVSEDFETVLIPFRYDALYLDFDSDGTLFRAERNGKCGLIDINNETILPFVANYFYSLCNGMRAYNTDIGFGYMDSSGAPVISPRFSDANNFYEGLAAVAVNGIWGYIDRTGAFVIQPQFNSAEDFFAGLAIVEESERYGLIDKTGKMIVPLMYQEIRGTSEDLYAVKKDNLWGVINEAGKMVIPAQFEDISWFSSDLCAVKKNGKWGFIDKTGRVVIGYRFANAGYFDGPYAILWLDEDYDESEYNPDAKVGVIDRTGAFVLGPTTEDAFDLSSLEWPSSLPADYDETVPSFPSQLNHHLSKALTRAECCVLLSWLHYELTGKRLPPPKTDPFADTHDFEVRQCYEAGYITGTSPQKFRPDAPVSRQDFAVMMTRLLDKADIDHEFPGADATVFLDQSLIAPYATSPVGRMSSYGIILGYRDKFNPKGNITREHAFLMAVRLHDLMCDKGQWRNYSE